MFHSNSDKFGIVDYLTSLFLISIQFLGKFVKLFFRFKKASKSNFEHFKVVLSFIIIGCKKDPDCWYKTEFIEA